MRTGDQPSRRSSRRRFLKTLGSAGAAMAVPTIVPRSVFGAFAPSNRIGVGVIGNGNQATIDIPAFLQNDDVQVLAVCDVNAASGGYRTPQQFLGRKPAQEQVNKYYAEQTGRGQYRGCDAYSDFREVVARSDIDAVAIIVPDHWHALMTVAAAKAGKDIYCEKPLSLTVADGQAMVQAVRQHGRILQTGSHWRSHPLVRHACELVRNGRIGKLQRILTSLPPNNAVSPGVGWQPMPVPAGFEYDMWLGPAPQAEYHPDRCFYRFRFILDYSGGQVTNFGAHRNDIAQWGHGTDRTGPVAAVNVLGKRRQDLRTPHRAPHLGIGDRSPVVTDQRIRQLVLRHFRFVVIRIRRFLPQQRSRHRQHDQGSPHCQTHGQSPFHFTAR